MTKQEAIKILNKYDLNFCDIDGNPIPPQDLAEAFDMAIKALEQQPVLDKIRAEIEQIEINGYIRDIECFRAGIDTALNVINKYKMGSEE